MFAKRWKDNEHSNNLFMTFWFNPKKKIALLVISFQFIEHKLKVTGLVSCSNLHEFVILFNKLLNHVWTKADDKIFDSISPVCWNNSIQKERKSHNVLFTWAKYSSYLYMKKPLKYCGNYEWFWEIYPLVGCVVKRAQDEKVQEFVREWLMSKCG